MAPTVHRVMGCCHPPSLLHSPEVPKSPSLLLPNPFCSAPSHGSRPSSGLTFSLAPSLLPSFPFTTPPHRAPESLSMPRVDPAPPCSQPSQGFPVPWFRGNLWHQSYQPLWPCLPSFLPPVMLQSHQTPANPLTSSGVHEQLRASAPAAPLPLATFLYPDTW